MDKLVRQVTKVIKSLDKNGFTFVSQDNCEDELLYEEIEGHEITIGDDNHREQWVVDLEEVKGPTDLLEVLVKVLGQPSKVHSNGVRNWEPVKNVTIIGNSDSVMFIQDYVKR